MNDTPRTDAEHAQFPMGGFTLDFARKLERELTAARSEATHYEAVAQKATDNLIAVREELAILNAECGTWWAQKRIAIDELKEVTEQRDQWKEKYIQQNKDLGHELRDPNGTIWSECKRLQTELDVVTEQRDGLRSGIDYASDQLTTVTEQRDRLLEQQEQWRLSSVCRELVEQREEARRLAERYRNLSCDSQEEADETLLPWETTNPNKL